MNEYKVTDTVYPLKNEVNLGDRIHLTAQVQEVVECQETGVKMLNIDADELSIGDLPFIKKLGLTISNPDTDKPVALGVDYEEKTFGSRIKSWLEDEDDNDDSGFFFTPAHIPTPIFGGGRLGGFGGGFGGFGGGSFGGGGASRSF